MSDYNIKKTWYIIIPENEDLMLSFINALIITTHLTRNDGVITNSQASHPLGV